MQKNLLFLKDLSILFVEDDPIMLEQTHNTLNIFFKNVYTATNIQSAYSLYENNIPDIILSDIQLLDGTGLELVATIRKKDYKTPIILLTSFSNNEYLFQAVNLGIDGYIIKPLKLDNLLEAFFKALKREEKHNLVVKLADDIYYHFSTKDLLKIGSIIPLGAKEQQLLRLFVENSGKTLSKEEISYYLWPLEDVTDSALKNLLNRLRQKIGTDMISTIKGNGWRLNSTL
jgi:DNA-binding response OmpR family regulator